MQRISEKSPLFAHRVLLNGYPIQNECSEHSNFLKTQRNKFDNNSVYYDDYYGRFFRGSFLNKVKTVYGNPAKIYDHGATIHLPIIDYLQVPYRLIPIYKANNCSEIKEAIEQMKMYSHDYTFLLRGQNKIYFLERKDQEKTELYGHRDVREPSFLPSFQRKSLDYDKTASVWHNVCALLINELANESSNKERNDNLLFYRNTEWFHVLALGLAQHYGLPSIGLDLTDDLSVALWFAIYDAHYSNREPVTADLISGDNNEATIFVFRCPRLSIFKYPEFEQYAGAHRPIAQKAYFNHCGWGLSKNQLALNLTCGFRVNSSFAEELPNNFIRQLFPSVKEDRVLRILLRIKELYQETELGEMLDSIYL